MKKIASVVIPTYNSNEKLYELLCSLETRNDIEYIIIDDGSILNQKKYIPNKLLNSGNTKFIRTKNYGVSCARNLGISLAEGEYIIFVDSDDVILFDEFSQFIDDLIYINKNMNIDIIRVGFYKFSNKKLEFKKIGVKKKFIVPNDKYIKKFLLCKKYDNRETVTQIYRKKFIVENELFFSSNILCEDADFFLKCLKKNKNKIYISNNIYYVYKNYLLNTRSKSENMYVDCCNLFTYFFCKEKNIYLKAYLYSLILDHNITKEHKKILVKNIRYFLFFIFYILFHRPWKSFFYFLYFFYVITIKYH